MFAIRHKKTHRVYEGYSWDRLSEDERPAWSFQPDDYSKAVCYSTREAAEDVKDHCIDYLAKYDCEVVEVNQ